MFPKNPIMHAVDFTDLSDPPLCGARGWVHTSGYLIHITCEKCLKLLNSTKYPHEWYGGQIKFNKEDDTNGT